jgi:uncharacterized protein (TIGR03435 family)
MRNATARSNAHREKPAASKPGVDPSIGPAFFAALRAQLGLELTPEVGPVDVRVIDRVDKP